ncbi:MAG TPA: hypothetical protein VNF06_01960 [Candidatus Aquilonibacter sp.]|nr:hypothetical protein [Candidatus Aquilonibacter sp.]
MAQTLKQKQIIIPLNKDATYLGAYKLVGGNLPSNVLHDKYLVETNEWKQLSKEGYYEAWAKEIIVYPAMNKKFQKGKDVVDGNWIFDKESMPQEAVGKDRVALFIKEPIIKEDGGKVIISAKQEEIVVLQNFLQKDGWGKVDEATRMPFESKNLDSLNEDQKRYLWRRGDESVRPLARNAYYYDNRRDVYADWGRVDALGVARVGSEEVAEKISASAKVNELKALVHDAKASLSEQSERMKKIDKLVQELGL